MKIGLNTLKGMPVQEIFLDNGLRIYLFDVPESGRIYADLWFNVGAKHEQRDEFGISHFLEHMVFKGSERMSAGEIDRITGQAGGYNNAATHSEYTHYFFVMPRRKLDLALSLLSEMCIKPALDPSDFASEREVVLEEMKQYRDHPLHAPYLVHQLGFYKDTPWGHNTLGTEEALLALTPETMRVYHNSYYRPDNASLVIAGGLPKNKKLLHLLNKHFGSWVKPRRKLPSFTPAALMPGQHIHISPGKIESIYGYLSIPAPGGDLSRDSAVLSMLLFVLAGTFTSRLNQALVENEQLCQNFDLASEDTYPVNSLIFNFITDSTDKVQRILEKFRANLARISEEHPTFTEVSSAKASLSSARAFGCEDARSAGGWLGDIAFPRRNLDEVERFIDYQEKTTPAEITELAARIMSGIGRAALTISYPESLAVPKVPDDIRRFFRKGVSSGVSDKAKTVASQPRMIGKLDCGAKVYGWQSSRSETFSLRAHFPFDILSEPLKGISRITNQLLIKGTKRKTAKELSAAFESVGASVGAAFSPMHFGIEASLRASDWRLAAEIIPEMLFESAFQPNEVKKARWDATVKLMQLRDQNHSVAWEKFALEFLKKSPLSVQTLGSEDNLAKITSRIVQRYARDLIAPSRMIFVAAGRFDDAELIEMLNSEIGKYKFTSEGVAYPREGKFRGGKKRIDIDMDKEQSAIIVGFPARGITHPDSLFWEIFNCILGAGANSKLFSRLRDRESLAYSVSSSYIAGKKLGFITTTLLCSREKLDDAWEGIFREVRALFQKGVTKREFSGAKAFIAEQISNSLETTSGKCRELAKAAVLGLEPDSMLARIKAINKMRFDDFSAFLSRETVADWGGVHAGRIE